MKRLLFSFISGLVLSIALVGCGGQEVTQSSSPPPRATPPAPVKTPAQPLEAPPEPEAKYVYSPSGKRDPFEALVLVKKPLEGGEEVPLTPLQKFDLSQFRLIGLIVGKGEPRAMVVAPDSKAYILKKGVKVGKNDGTVIDIRKEAVLVEEQYLDFSGEVKTNIQLIELPKKEGA